MSNNYIKGKVKKGKRKEKHPAVKRVCGG